MSLRKSAFAAMYDRCSRPSEEAGLGQIRQRLLADASGDVLELGAGTGVNLSHYDTDLASLVLTEPEPAMLRRLRRKMLEQAILITIVVFVIEALRWKRGIVWMSPFTSRL